jgi:hypothetical protein
MKVLLLLLFFFSLHPKAAAQAYYLVVPLGQSIFPEHGFLPGKKFVFYPTIDKYDFSGLKIRVEVFDDRKNLDLANVDCPGVMISNASEFAGQNGASKVYEYFQHTFHESNIVIDSLASDTLKVTLEALDSRLIGFGYVTPHGLCEMKMDYKSISKTYCIDITDTDKHSPISNKALVTRKTATRVITSAAIREVIEQFLIDLKALPLN